MQKRFLLVILALLVLLGLGIFFGMHKPAVPVNNPDSNATSTNPTATTTPVTVENLPFTLPVGFQMSTFAKGVAGARVIAIGPKGVMLVSETSEGKVVALPDMDGNGKADKIVTVVQGLNNPHGIAFLCTDGSNPENCKLYIAETTALDVFDYDATLMKATNKIKLLDLPSDGRHFTRTLLFMPSPNENTLLISVGSSCDVCRETDVRRASVLAYDVTTGKSEAFATGLRNSVFMQIHPVTGAVFATEMGRDYLGDNLPPDEINILEKGKNYGWPNCYGKNIHDVLFDKNTYIQNPCMSPFETPSHINLQAHSAPLGLAFIPEEGWPEAYWNNLLVAYHGSWNRTTKTGYKIVRIKLDSQGNYSGENPPTEDFITGWLRPNGTTIGRPADIKVLSGGTMYVSDDQAGLIYKVVVK